MDKRMRNLFALLRKPLTWVFALSLVLQLFPLQGMAYAVEEAQQALGVQEQIVSDAPAPVEEVPAPAPQPQETTPEPAPEPEPEPAVPAEPVDEPVAEAEPIDELSTLSETNQLGEVELLADDLDDQALVDVDPEAQAEVEGSEEPTRAEGETAQTWTVTFYDRDGDEYKKVEVARGSAIGEQLPATISREDYNAYWAIGEIVEGSQGTEIRVTGPRIDASFVPTADTTIVPDYEKITYKVTFYEEDKATVVTTKTVDVDTSYCLNDIPSVPTKSGYTGKWVYSGGDFTNAVTITGNTDVWAEYAQNTFTVTYVVNGATYETDTYYSGDKLTLPKDPVVSGKDFEKWVDGNGNQVKAGDAVTSDLTLTAVFDDQFHVQFGFSLSAARSIA